MTPDLFDLGALLHTVRRVGGWRRLAVRAAVVLALVLVVTRDPAVVVGAAAGVAVVAALAAYARFEVHEHGVVIRGTAVTRRYHWSQITGFSPMPDSKGRPGRTGAVVVDGVNRPIPTLREPALYPKLRHLNAILLSYREDTGTTAPPPPDRRTTCSRSAPPLWLGPGAAWWPAEHPDRDRR